MDRNRQWTIHSKYLSSVAPRRGAWIEILSTLLAERDLLVAPRRGAWIEIDGVVRAGH